MPRKQRKPDPVKICSRKHKGWAFVGSMTIGQYKAEEDKITQDLETLTDEQFRAKYRTWMY